MNIELLVYLEHGATGPVWWTESPQVPGFHASGRHLQEAVLRAKIALGEILDAGMEGIELDCRLVGSPQPSEGEAADARVSGDIEDAPKTSGVSARLLVEA